MWKFLTSTTPVTIKRHNSTLSSFASFFNNCSLSHSKFLPSWLFPPYSHRQRGFHFIWSIIQPWTGSPFFINARSTKRDMKHVTNFLLLLVCFKNYVHSFVLLPIIDIDDRFYHRSHVIFVYLVWLVVHLAVGCAFCVFPISELIRKNKKKKWEKENDEDERLESFEMCCLKNPRFSFNFASWSPKYNYYLSLICKNRISFQNIFIKLNQHSWISVSDIIEVSTLSTIFYILITNCWKIF